MMPRESTISGVENSLASDARESQKAKSTAAIDELALKNKVITPRSKTLRTAAKKQPKSQVGANQTQVLKNVPAWDSWNRRHTITLIDAICTVHNIVANKSLLEKLKKAKDPRLKSFSSHMKTLKDWVRNAPDVLKVEDQEGSKKVINSTRIYLAPFIQWVKEEDPFPGLLIPKSFFELTPPAPKNLDKPTSKVTSSLLEKQEATCAESDKAMHKKWAKLLIALAMKHYSLQPKIPAKGLMAHRRGIKDEGLYAPLESYCESVGIDRLSIDTIRGAFEGAVDFLGDEFVDKLEKHAKGKAKTEALKQAIRRHPVFE